MEVVRQLVQLEKLLPKHLDHLMPLKMLSLKLQLHNLVQVGLGYALKQMVNYAFVLQQIKIIQ